MSVAELKERALEASQLHDQAEVFEKAAKLLLKPGAWCQHATARNAQGVAVDSLSPEAVSWCMLGAIGKVLGVTETGLFAELEERGNVPLWSEVVSLVERTFSKAELGQPTSWQDMPHRQVGDVVGFLKSAAVLLRAKARRLVGSIVEELSAEEALV